MAGFYNNAVRHPEDVGVGHIRRRIPYNTSSFANGIAIGALEKGAIPLRAYAIVNTAFNAGTTNVLTLGNKANAGSGQSLVVDSIVTSANAAAGATGVKAGTGVALGSELPADTVFYAYYNPTGTAATAGDVTFVVEFVNARQWVDQLGNQVGAGQNQ